MTGKDAPLEVREGGIAGRGVFAVGPIHKGQWLCEYRGLVYPLSELDQHCEEYTKNNEGVYVVESSHPVGGGTRLCWDATRCLHQTGRYLNHAQQANAGLTSPVFIRKKWRIGFVACKEIREGDEVVWDYGVRGEMEWGRCRLVDGAVRDVAGPSGTCDKEVRAVCVHYYTAYPLTFFRPQKMMRTHSRYRLLT